MILISNLLTSLMQLQNYNELFPKTYTIILKFRSKRKQEKKSLRNVFKLEERCKRTYTTTNLNQFQNYDN